MAGGYGMIESKDGKPFEKGNQAAKKWTQEKAVKLGKELIQWLREPDNFLFEEFLIIEKGLYRDLVRYLANKYSAFSDLIQIAKEIQELKIVKGAVKGEFSSAFSKFALINHHGYKHSGAEFDINMNQNNVHVFIPHNIRDDYEEFKDADVLTSEQIAEIDARLAEQQKELK